MSESSIKTIKKHFEKVVSMNDKAISDWKKAFDEQQAFSLTWASDMFKNVATRDVYKEICHALEKAIEKGEPFESLKSRMTAYTLSHVVTKASFSSRSTSATSNLISDCNREAWAEMYKFWSECD